MATKITEVTPKAKIPSKEVKDMLAGYSIAKQSIAFKVLETELGEFAPVIEVQMLKNSDIKILRDIHKSDNEDGARGDELESFIQKCVKSVKIYDISTDSWETLSNSEEDYDYVPQPVRIAIINKIFAANGMV